jgi:hypothetical protein
VLFAGPLLHTTFCIQYCDISKSFQTINGINNRFIYKLSVYTCRADLSPKNIFYSHSQKILEKNNLFDAILSVKMLRVTRALVSYGIRQLGKIPNKA